MDKSQSLKRVLKKTVEVLEESKRDIFSIAESSRKEFENIKSELNLIKTDVHDVIDNINRLERINKKARIRLMEVSRDFYHFTEDDIKEAYRKAEETSVEIAVLREKEEQLKTRRTEFENRLRNSQENIDRAEGLVSRVSVIKEFLSGELHNLSDHFDDLRQKHNLAIKIIQAQEEERKRVAREIHDGPAQSIANLVFRVEFTQQLMDKDMVKAKAELEELKEIIRLSMQDVRKIIYNLRPMSLDDLGLIPTLKRYIDKFINETGIMIDFDEVGSKQRLARSYEVTIFRLIQEALNNIYKHSKASEGKVIIEYGEEHINLLIRDDGIGFNTGEVGDDKYGLINMKERCNLLSGSITIDSDISRGTIIKIILPKKRGDLE